MTSSKMTSSKQWSLPPWSVCGLLIFLLLTACSTQGLSSSTPTVRAQPTQQPSPGSSPVAQQPTQQPSPGPSPVATLLAQAPQGCSLGPSLGSKVFPQFNGSPATGSGPVWESGLPPNATVNVDDLGYTPWPGTKILWPIGPDFPGIVTVRVTNLRTEAWWDIGVGPPPSMPVRPLILDGLGNRGGGPPTFGAFLYLPQAGCYAMTVSWTGGQWRLLFAVGR